MSRLTKLLGWARRRPHHFMLLWMGGAWLVLSACGGYLILHERQRLLEQAGATAQNHAAAAANRIEAAVAKADVLLNFIAVELERPGGGKQAELAQLIESTVANHPELMAVMITDVDGHPTPISRPKMPATLEVGDRDYFRYHREHADAGIRIGAPVISRLTGKAVIPITRRLNDAHGRFAGIAFVGLANAHFEQEFQRLQLGPMATFAVSDSAGTILLRSPAVAGAVGISIAGWDVFDRQVRGQDAGAGESVCPIDGVTRIHAFRRLHRYPMIAYAGISVEAVASEWRAALWQKLPLLLAVLALLAGSGLLFYRQLLAGAKARLRLKASLRRADLANLREQALNEALQKASDFREAVLHSTACGILVTDVTGAILFMNRASTKILGFTPDEVLGKMSPLVFHRTEDVRAALQRIRPGDTPYLLMIAHLNAHPGREWQFIRKDGSPVPVSLTITTLKDRGGRLEGFVTIFHDLTELNRLEDLKSDFVSVVSHELRTPLTAIRGALSLHRAAAGDAPLPSQQRLLAIAHDNCDRLMRIISDVLDIDKLSRKKLRLDRTIESVEELVGRAIAQTEAFASQYGVSCRLNNNGNGSGLRLSLDADRFVQVMVNLLSNAAKFSHPQGEVLVSVREESGSAVIRVVDYGIGIPEAFQPLIFERFSQHAAALTRKTGGTGLGLAITKMLVEAHGGTVSFTSEQGMGSTFTVSLPLMRDAVAASVPEDARGGGERQGGGQR